MAQDRNQRAPVSEEYLRASTLGELTALAAPIRLVEYDPQWPHRFEEELKQIRTVLGQHALRIEHDRVPNNPEKEVPEKSFSLPVRLISAK